MTIKERDEAIRFFETMLKLESNIKGAHFEYSKLALEALKQEPCADMVSRDAMWDVLQKLYGTEGELVEELMSLPPVLPMPKMGRWIDIMVGDVPAQACDQCNTFYPLAYTGGGHKYCPNCGAKMQEVE